MEQKSTLTETAYRHIFEGITSGKYRVGQTLSIDKLSSTLKMSKTPIREALVELEGEGLVYRRSRYYNVMYLSKEDVIDLYETRIILEAEAARLAALRATDQQLEDMKTTLRAIEELTAVEKPDPLLLTEMNGKLHWLIATACGNNTIAKYCTDIRLRLKAVRTSLFTSMDRREDELREHTGICNAIVERNSDEALKRMLQHERNVMKYVDRVVLPELF